MVATFLLSCANQSAWLPTHFDYVNAALWAQRENLKTRNQESAPRIPRAALADRRVRIGLRLRRYLIFQWHLRIHSAPRGSTVETRNRSCTLHYAREIISTLDRRRYELSLETIKFNPILIFRGILLIRSAHAWHACKKDNLSISHLSLSSASLSNIPLKGYPQNSSPEAPPTPL